MFRTDVVDGGIESAWDKAVRDGMIQVARRWERVGAQERDKWFGWRTCSTGGKLGYLLGGRFSMIPLLLAATMVAKIFGA